MGKKRLNAEEIIGLLRQAEVLLGQGRDLDLVLREIGATRNTFYRWRKEYGGRSASLPEARGDCVRDVFERAKGFRPLGGSRVRAAKLSCDITEQRGQIVVVAGFEFEGCDQLHGVSPFRVGRDRRVLHAALPARGRPRCTRRAATKRRSRTCFACETCRLAGHQAAPCPAAPSKDEARSAYRKEKCR